GRPPFQAETVFDTLTAARERQPESPRRSNPRVDRKLEVICLKCLEKDPQRRYGSAQALADDLERWLAGEPIHAQPAGRAERLWRWCRANPALATAAGLAGVALLAVSVVSILWGVRETSVNRKLQAALAEGQLRRAENQLDHGLSLCDRGDVG